MACAAAWRIAASWTRTVSQVQRIEALISHLAGLPVFGIYSGPLGLLAMSRSSTSSLAACVWIPLFSLRCEEARHEGLAAYTTALLAPDTTRKLWQVSSLARHAGVKQIGRASCRERV